MGFTNNTIRKTIIAKNSKAIAPRLTKLAMASIQIIVRPALGLEAGFWFLEALYNNIRATPMAIVASGRETDKEKEKSSLS